MNVYILVKLSILPPPRVTTQQGPEEAGEPAMTQKAVKTQQYPKAL